jgi:hypothetical protein
MLAIAAGVLISPALMAADIATNTDTRDLSDEYLSTANATDEVFGGALVVELGAEYTVDDVITLTFSGDALDNTSLLPSIDVLEAGTFKGLTLGLLSSTSGEAVYRVTALTGASTDTTNGLLVTIADATYRSAHRPTMVWTWIPAVATIVSLNTLMYRHSFRLPRTGPSTV